MEGTSEVWRSSMQVARDEATRNSDPRLQLPKVFEQQCAPRRCVGRDEGRRRIDVEDQVASSEFSAEFSAALMPRSRSRSPTPRRSHPRDHDKSTADEDDDRSSRRHRDSPPPSRRRDDPVDRRRSRSPPPPPRRERDGPIRDRQHRSNKFHFKDDRRRPRDRSRSPPRRDRSPPRGGSKRPSWRDEQRLESTERSATGRTATQKEAAASEETDLVHPDRRAAVSSKNGGGAPAQPAPRPAGMIEVIANDRLGGKGE
jgi:hypothetical protein